MHDAFIIYVYPPLLFFSSKQIGDLLIYWLHIDT